MHDALTVLHAITPAQVGGLESAVRLLASAQLARGHRVHVLATIDGAEPPVISDLREAGASVTTIVAPGRAYAHEWRQAAAAMACIDPHIVHTHGYRADLLTGAVARRAHVPVVTTLHGFVGGDWKLRVYETLQRRSLRRFDAVVAVSPAMAQAMSQRIRDSRLHVIPNAYAAVGRRLSRAEARARLGIPDAEFRIGWIGRISPEKGPDVMVRALADPSLAGAQLSVIGDGPDRAKVETLASDAGVTPRVDFHGMIQNASALLAAFDVIVLSSRTEGTPIVLLEAMAAGVPIVATRVGGIPDVLTSEQALLVDPEEAHALATAIATVRRDPALARVRAERALDRLLTGYNVESWVARYDDVYNTIIMKHRRQAA